MTRTEHLLTILEEECAEVIHRASKLLRFGPNDVDPDTGYSARSGLVYELNDLMGVLLMLAANGTIPENWESSQDQCIKRAKVEKFLEYSRTMKTLTE